MPKTTNRSFVAGELDPALHQRVDLAKYATGLATCKNFFMRSQGGIYNRPGLRFVGEVLDSTAKTRLVPFQFNTTQTYILEFSPLKMRVIKDGAYVLDGAGPSLYELTTPYTESDLFDTDEEVFMLQFTQTADVMTICHRGHPVKELSRLDHDNWTLSSITFASDIEVPVFITAGPWTITNATVDGSGVVTVQAYDFTFIDESIVTIDSVVGMVELNGNSYKVGDKSGKFWVTDHYERTFTLRDTETGDYIDGSAFTPYVSGGAVNQAALSNTGSGRGSYNKTYRYVVTVTDEDGQESLPSVEGSILCRSLSQTYGVRLEWDSVEGASYYTVYKDTANGTGIYGFIGETKGTTFDDYNVAGDTSRTPPEENDPISSADNYPGAVGYYQQRRLFGNTINTPQSLYATQVGIFNSMRSSTPARDDDALDYTINSRQVNEIRHIVDLEDLMLLTAGAEFRVTEGQDFILTPSTIGAKVQSYYGASWVRPTTVGNTVIYVQEKGGRIRNLDYSVDDGKYTGNDLSVMSEHLFKDRTVVEMAYAAEPYGILWCVMSDGTLIGMTYQKEHQVWGWHRHETDGEFESVAVIREGNRDAVYFVIKRVIDGNTVRYVERMEPRYDDVAENAFFVDSGLTYSGTATTAISGLDHLEGETVVAVADGNVVENLTVTSGAITLPTAASLVQIGLPYVSEAKTLILDNTETTLQGRKKNVASVSMRILNSRGGWVGPTTDDMIEIKPRFDSDGYDPIALKSYEQGVAITADWNDNGQIVVQQPDPLPMAITAITPEFDIGG